MVVISNEHKNGLKGQPILAQGKRRRSVTLGLETGRKIVRAMELIKKQFSFRTKWIGSCFIEKNVLQFRPKEAFALNIMFPRTVFSVHHLPRATFGSFLPNFARG